MAAVVSKRFGLAAAHALDHYSMLLLVTSWILINIVWGIVALRIVWRRGKLFHKALASSNSTRIMLRDAKQPE